MERLEYDLLFRWFVGIGVELSKADTPHGWCAGLLIHHSHMIPQYPEAAQKTVWAGGLDVPVAVSLVPVSGRYGRCGYRISSKGSPFVSCVDYCT